VKSTAEKIAKIFVVGADLPDFENHISIEKIEEVGSAINVCAFMYVCMYGSMYVCMFMEVCVCICIPAGHVCMAAGK
jgi:hypothetical protein